MRFLKLAILSFILIFLLFTAISLFIPSRIRISRSISIGAPENVVMAQIDNIRQWTNWYPGFDTLKIDSLEGKNGKLVSANLPGNVTVLFTDVKPDEIVAELRSKRKKPMVNGWKTFVYPGTDSVILHWYMDFRLRWYPWEKFSGLLLERNYGTRLEHGLIKLKENVEK